jgi:mannitol/fructose-specific phosphotransferase system IIA component (Ntr-type)
MFESSFLVVARTLQEIHFGAPDGRPTDLFFLVCCQEDRLHLHTLARICVMVMKTDLLTQLRMAEDAAQMHTVLLEAEVAALADRRPPE